MNKIYIVICVVEHEAEYIEACFANERSAELHAADKQMTAGKWDTFVVREHDLLD